MNRITIASIIAAALTVMLSGCMSMDEMLASDDPFWHDIGESQAMRFAIDAYDANPLQQKLDVIAKMSDQDKLARVYVAKTTVQEVKTAARAKINKESAFATMLMSSEDPSIRREAMANIKTDGGLIDAALKIYDSGNQKEAEVVLWKVQDAQATASVLKDILEQAMAIRKKKYISDMDTKLYMKLYDKFAFLAPYSSRDVALLKLAKRTDVMETKGHSDDFVKSIECKLGAKQEAKAEAIAKAEEDKKVKLLKTDPAKFASLYPAEVESFKAKLAAKEEAEVKEHAATIDNLLTSQWNRGEVSPLNQALQTAKSCGDEVKAVRLFAMVVDKIGYFKKACEDSFSMRWSDEDGERARLIIKSGLALPYPNIGEKTAAYLADHDLKGMDLLADSAGPNLKDAISAAGEMAKSISLLKQSDVRIAGEVLAMKNPEALRKMVSEHPIRLVRAVAANKLGKAEFDKYITEHPCESPADNASVGGLFLGMDVGDAYAILIARCPSFDYSFEYPKREDSVSTYDDYNLVAKVSGAMKRIVYANCKTGKVRKIMLPPELTMNFFPNEDTVDGIGKNVSKELGLKLNEATEEVKINGHTVADQAVLKYASISGAFASFAIEKKEVYQSAIDLMIPDGDVGGFQSAVNYVIANQMGAPGTLILSGVSLKRRVSNK